jgi:hypothetical protein
MAKIVRLTESDLVRLVKKVIKEQAVSGGASGGGVWNMLKKAIDGLTTDEGGVKSACGMVTSPQIYQQLLALAKKEGYNTVMEYIMTDFGFGNGPVRTERSIGVNYDEWGTHPEVGGLWSKDEDTQTPLFCAAVFKKFNPKEYESFNKGVRVDKAV